MLLDKLLLVANKGDKIINVCEENGTPPNALEGRWGDNDWVTLFDGKVFKNHLNEGWFIAEELLWRLCHPHEGAYEEEGKYLHSSWRFRQNGRLIRMLCSKLNWWLVLISARRTILAASCRVYPSKILITVARVRLYLYYNALTLQSILIECRYQLNCVMRDPAISKSNQELAGTESKWTLSLFLPPWPLDLGRRTARCPLLSLIDSGNREGFFHSNPWKKDSNANTPSHLLADRSAPLVYGF